MCRKIRVNIRGDVQDEHFTYVERDGRYYEFYATRYEGISANVVIGFLKFLGYEVSEVHSNATNIPKECIVN